MELPRGVNRLTAQQARAARAVLDYSMQKLAAESGISESSIRRVESSIDGPVKVDLLLKLQAFFERKGLTFSWAENECGVTWKCDPSR